MFLTQKFLTNNDCYRAKVKMKPQGIMVHSTATPGVKNDGWFKAWNKSGISKCVHAFVDETGVMQTLPWDIVGWHSGVGSLGKSKNANNTGYIGFEICEPAGHGYSGGTMTNYDKEKNQEYFDAVYSTSVELCAYLCKEFGISADKIICHREGHTLGIASNHSDVMQWFPKHNKSMDTFRADVKKLLNGEAKMRNFKLKEEMNFRKTPNGEKIGVIPAGVIVGGTVLEENRGILWLKTTYNGKEGFVAVLPENKNYAQEIFEQENNSMQQELEFYKTKCVELESKINNAITILQK